MYGLVLRAVQCFAEDTYGPILWDKVVADAELDKRDFEAMLHYSDETIFQVVDALSERLDKDRDTVLEDLGTYLVTYPRMEPVRRLLRFGGHEFKDFLSSLDDLHDRVKLALPDLELPQLEMNYHGGVTFRLLIQSSHRGFGPVMVGILRAMADDYGALVLLNLLCEEHENHTVEHVEIELLQSQFAEGREFNLTQEAMAK